MAGVGNTKEFTATDGSGPTGDILNCNTVVGQTEVPNGKVIQGYSDAYATASWKIAGGGLATAISATSPDPGAGGTIATANVGIALVTPAAARAGIILQAGTINGQEVWIVNQGAAANTLTLNTTPATANVADSATESAIAGLKARKYVWIGGSTNLWYPTS